MLVWETGGAMRGDSLPHLRHPAGTHDRRHGGLAKVMALVLWKEDFWDKSIAKSSPLTSAGEMPIWLCGH